MTDKEFDYYLQEPGDGKYYNLNSLAYYFEDMAKKEILIKELAKRIVEYDAKQNLQLTDVQDKVAAELAKWDQKTTELPETVNGLLQEWLDDGIVEGLLLSKKADQVEVDNISKELDLKASKAAGSLLSTWKVPVQPLSGNIVSHSTNPEDYINNLWEPLRKSFPDYITRTTEGKDSSGVHNLYTYVFTPDYYEKTIILGAQIHGEEYESQKILYRVLHHICYDADNVPQLNYIRNKVRIVVIPIQNPAGIALQQRLNANGVDINRNVPYGWNSSTGEPKGTAPLSENETKIIDSVMAKYPDAVSYLDFHNTSPTNTTDYYAEVPRFFQNNANLIYRVINSIKPKPNVTKNIRTTQLPVICNHAASVYGMNSAIVEWVPGSLSGTPYDSLDMTYAVSFFANVIFEFCKLEKAQVLTLKEPKSIAISHSSTAINTNLTTYNEITQLTITLNPEVNGLLMLNGDFSILATDITALQYVTPVITQVQNPKIPTSSVESQQIAYEIYSVIAGGRGHIGFNRTVPVLASNLTYGPVVIKFYWKTSAGTLQHLRSRMSILFIPTENMGYEEYSNDSNHILYKSYPPTIT